MTRRALSPAARGVLLAVSAALRGRVAEIHDGADGTTTATVTEPDGTVLLRCVVRAVGRRDSRQVLLPLAPGAPHQPPAPQALPVRVRVWIAEEQWDSQGDDGREILHCPASEPVAWDGRVGWVTALVPPGPTLGQLRSLQRELGYTLHEGDEPPVRIRGLAVGDRITLDEDQAEVMGVDDRGFCWRTVDGGQSYDEGDCEWSDVDETAPGVFRVRPVETETPAQRRTAKAPKVRPVAARPHRRRPEPEADALARHGEVSLVGQQEPGGTWELAASAARLPPATWGIAREAYVRVREYNRGGRCTRDTADEGGAS